MVFHYILYNIGPLSCLLARPEHGAEAEHVGPLGALEEIQHSTPLAGILQGAQGGVVTLAAGHITYVYIIHALTMYHYIIVTIDYVKI